MVPPLYLDFVLHKGQNPRLIIGRERGKPVAPFNLNKFAKDIRNLIDLSFSGENDFLI